MRHLDLCSGIGGFALAARWMGWETVGFAEIDPFCCRVLKKHWPEVPNYGDIAAVPTGLRADIITAGLPCQPYSCAGKRLGAADDRALWPLAFRVIAGIRPAWIVLENVAGFIEMALSGVLADLESEGYETQAIVLPACAVNAPHRRDRVWVIAHDAGRIAVPDASRIGERKPANEADALANGGQARVESGERREPFSDADSARLEGRDGAILRECADQRLAGSSRACSAGTDHAAQCGRKPEPAICGVPNEFSDRLDEVGLDEYRDAKTTTARPNQVLPILREADTQEALRKGLGKQICFQEKEILQHDMRRNKSSKGSTYACSITKESGGICRAELPRMRDDRKTPGSPYRYESSEQRILEHHDVVRCLSRFMALEAWPSSGIDDQQAIAMLRLQQGISELKAGYVPETLSEIQEVWRSIDDETMEWLIIRVSTGDPFCAERPDIPRVVTGVKDRAKRLKALGNSIVPQVAYQIFKAIAASSALPRESAKPEHQK